MERDKGLNKELKRIFSEKKAGSKGYHLLKYNNVSLDDTS